jgi:hypothetical protein
MGGRYMKKWVTLATAGAFLLSLQGASLAQEKEKTPAAPATPPIMEKAPAAPKEVKEAAPLKEEGKKEKEKTKKPKTKTKKKTKKPKKQEDE